MPRFRTKPTEIEAVQFNPHEHPWPHGVHSWEGRPQPRDMSWGYVITIHGQKAHVHAGDWIVREPDGEHYYPVKPHIFAAKYEPAPQGRDD